MADRLHVLVVDDSEAIRDIAERVLSKEGHTVTAVTGGEEALDAASRSSFDAALVDYDIPPPNGLDVLNRLRFVQPNCVRILMSGGLDVPVTLDAVNRGEISRIVPKPFAAAALPQAIADALAMRRRNGELYASAHEGGAQIEAGYLRQCFEEQLLRLAVQPILMATDSSVFGYEALLRSSHDVLNNPMAVLCAAERQAQLASVADVVARAASGWIHRLPATTRLFVNLHPIELADPEGMLRRLEPLSPWAERIVLEITERSNLSKIDAWEESAHRLVHAGFSLAVDDLGAGYSSLAVLASLQPQYIKVDMSIIRDIDTDRHKRGILELLCRFARANAATIVAEGVETSEEAKVVIEAGADLVQGYLYGRPSLEIRDAHGA